MRVTRFVSRDEWEAFERGETLINTTDHFDGGNGGSNSVGFCFTEDEPATAWRYLAGVVDADVWATFEFPDNYLTKSEGKFSDKSDGAGLFDMSSAQNGAAHRTTKRLPKSSICVSHFWARNTEG